jgi:predicted metal-dependent HD superfamily phosphohydrolase
MTEALESRWVSFCLKLGAKTKPALDAFEKLEKAYVSPTRHYHSFKHIQACLGLMDQYVPEDEWTKHVEMALWWHDYVYVPARPDNEEESMRAMHKEGRAMSLPELFIGQVADMIPYTKHNADLTFKPERYKYLVDVDLSILGEPEEVFDEYEKGVRAEYAFVPEAVFKARRAQILAEFLKRTYIFETDRFRSLFEGMARTNLKRSIEKLTA